MANTSGQFRLTKEESALMDECRVTSFWYRSVPLMAVTTGLMTYQRLKNPVPPKFYGIRLAGSILAAYLLGKLSYIPECRRLILQRLPNSNLARSLESKPYDLISDMAQPPEIVPKSTTTNIFGNRNEQVDDEQPVDMFPPDTTEKNTTKKYVTYDELRQRNRAEYASKFPANKARTDPSPTNPSTPIPPPLSNEPVYPPALTNPSPSPPSSSSSKRTNVRKNQYGDEVYD